MSDFKSYYIKAYGIVYANELKSIQKNTKDRLQPVFEAFINAWEAIYEKFNKGNLHLGKINIEFYFDTGAYTEEEAKDTRLEKIIVKDNGAGINEKSLERLINLRDGSKYKNNRGTGRVQFLHYFEDTQFNSVYYDIKSSKFKHITLTMSKKAAFILNNNAIIRMDANEDTKEELSGTIVTLKGLLDSKDDMPFYACQQLPEIKSAIGKHYLSLLCENRDCLPQITFSMFENDILVNTCSLIKEDIPLPDKTEPIFISYSKLDKKNTIIQTKHKEKFDLFAFVQPKEILKGNCIYFVSNGAIAHENVVDGLQKNDNIDGMRYLFLLKGEYFDKIDDDRRGYLHLIKKAEFKKQSDGNIFPEECILAEDIKEKTNSAISEIFPEFKARREVALANLDELQQMFLLDKDTVDSFRKKIKTSDNNATILQAIYTSDIEVIAKRDALLKEQIDGLKKLSPDQANYQLNLIRQVDAFVKTVPLQNRTNLTKYVAHRKLVLEVFDMILNKELDKLKNGNRIDENLLHNLIFQQHSDTTEDSDLWLINEEFIYFKGFSEHRLEDLEYNGEKIFDKPFTKEENTYLNSLGEHRLHKRPDILLFPDEGKCIIIEFKAPDVNVSEHLTQIDFYASLLRNYTINELHLTSFYGYLIGESIQDRDVRGRVSRFEYSPKFDYWFRPSEKVVGFDSREDGNIYTEIMRFSTLLERAKTRNKIFIQKLEKRENSTNL